MLLALFLLLFPALAWGQTYNAAYLEKTQIFTAAQTFQAGVAVTNIGIGVTGAAGLPYQPFSGGAVSYNALAIQIATTSSAYAEAAAAFSIDSSHLENKIALGAEVRGNAGTGSIWAQNLVMFEQAASGTYDAQASEIDIVNNNAHTGEDAGIGGIAAPFSLGISITAAGAFRNTAALYIATTTGAPVWNRGIIFYPSSIQQASIQDWSSAGISLDIEGNVGYGIYQFWPTSQNYFGGSLQTGGASLTAGRNVNINSNLGIQIGLQESAVEKTIIGTDLANSRQFLVYDAVAAAYRWQIDTVGRQVWGAVAQGSLGTPADGTMTYCNDCNIANPCTGGGTGALAKRLAGAWVCN
jgi:hypothetical protein